jgi:hypothetical protein
MIGILGLVFQRRIRVKARDGGSNPPQPLTSQAPYNCRAASAPQW